MTKMDLEEVQVATYLRGHPNFLQQWLERNVDKELLETVQRRWAQDSDEEDEQPKKPGPSVSLTVGLDLSSLNAKYNQAINDSPDKDEEDDEEPDDTMDDEPSPSVVPRTARKSVTSDLFHQWLASGTSSSLAARKDTVSGDAAAASDADA